MWFVYLMPLKGNNSPPVTAMGTLGGLLTQIVSPALAVLQVGGLCTLEVTAGSRRRKGEMDTVKQVQRTCYFRGWHSIHENKWLWLKKRRILPQILHCHCFTVRKLLLCIFRARNRNCGLLDSRIIQWKKEKCSSKTIKLECSVPASAKIKIRGTAISPNRWNILFYSTYMYFRVGQILLWLSDAWAIMDRSYFVASWDLIVVLQSSKCVYCRTRFLSVIKFSGCLQAKFRENKFPPKFMNAEKVYNKSKFWA